MSTQGTAAASGDTSRAKPGGVNRQRLLARVGLALALLTPLLLAGGATSSRIQSILVFSAVMALMAYSLNIFYYHTGMLSLAHAGLWGVGSYACALTVKHWSGGFWLGLVVSTAVGALVAAGVAVPSFRMRGISFLVFTFACGELLRFLLAEARSLTGGVNGLVVLTPPPTVLGYSLESLRARLVLTMALVYLAVLAHWLLGRSALGRRLMALRDDEELARASGVRPTATYMAAFCISGALAGTAGAAYQLHQVALTPGLFGVFLAITVILAIILGGKDSLGGPLIGAVALGMLPELIGLSPENSRLVYGAVLIVAVLAMPNGLKGLAARILPRMSQRDQAPLPEPRPVPTLTAASMYDAEEALSSEPVLQVSQLTKSFGSLVAVADVSFQVRSGEIFGIIGPNGSGKSTLLNCVAGQLQPGGGTVRFRGDDVTSWAAHKRARHGIARTFQRPAVFGSMDVATCIKVASEARNPNPTAWTTSDLIELTDLTAFTGTRATDLPYGAAKRLGLAVALAASPRLLLMDEPAAGLNDEETEDLARVVSEIRREGLTVCLVDHHMGFVLSVCDRMLALAAGAIMTTGLPADVARDPEVVSGYLGEEFLAEWTASG